MTEITVTTLWIAYAVTFIVLWIIFALIGYATTRDNVGMHIGTAFLFAAIFAVILFFTLSQYINFDSLSGKDQTSYAVGYYLSIALPFIGLLIAGWVVAAQAKEWSKKHPGWIQRMMGYSEADGCAPACPPPCPPPQPACPQPCPPKPACAPACPSPPMKDACGRPCPDPQTVEATHIECDENGDRCEVKSFVARNTRTGQKTAVSFKPRMAARSMPMED